MSRRHCPQNFDCRKMGTPPRHKCPNFEFCKEARLLGGNQELPYTVRTDDKGNNYLTVTFFWSDDTKEKFEQLGWACAERLPYQLFKFEGCPVLYVYFTTEGSGWARAEELPWEYFQWSAGFLSNSFPEFKELLAQHEAKGFYLWNADYFYEVWLIVN